MKSRPTDELVLFSLLPEVVWRLVLECLEPQAKLLEVCSKAIPFFLQMLEKRGRVLVCTPKPTILPLSLRDELQDYRSDEILFLVEMLQRQSPRLTTLHISLDEAFISLLSFFLESNSEFLETVSISYWKLYGISTLESAPVLRLPKMRNLRVLKLLRATTLHHISFTVNSPVYDVLPALESLTLSLGATDQWPDLLRWTEQEQHPVCPSVRHLRLIDYVMTDTSWNRAPHLAFVTLEKALKLFPNLVSVEVPARPGAEVVFQAKNLKCLTLIKDYWNQGNMYWFDMFLTGYSQKTCAGLLKKLNRQPGMISKKLKAERGSNITNLQALEILRIKCKTGKFGPTLVTLADLAKLKSFRSWEFSGHKPQYIPDDLLNGKMTAGFKISWKQIEVNDGLIPTSYTVV